MAVPPTPRTSPTVKPLVTSQRIKRDWEVRLTLLQVVVLAGVVFGCMSSAFYLGLISGQKAGFESAQAVKISSSVKLPINEEVDSAIAADDLGSDIYAKLRNPPTLKIDNDNALDGVPLPKLESIKTTDASPIPELQALEDAAIAEAEVKELPSKAVAQKADIEKILKDTSDNALKVASAKSVTERANIKSNDVVKPKDSAALSSLVPDKKKTDKVEKADVVEKVKLTKNTVKETAVSAQNLKPPSEVKNTVETEKIAPKVLATTAEGVKEAKLPVAPKSSSNSLIREVLPKGWFAQVAAPRQIADAEGLARKLEKSSFPVIVQEANVRGQIYYRVMVGPKDSRQGCEKMISQLKKENYLRGEPFLRLIK